MEKGITTQKRFETFCEIMNKKLDLVADYIKKGMDEYATIEIWSLQECLRLQLSDVIDLLPTRIL